MYSQLAVGHRSLPQTPFSVNDARRSLTQSCPTRIGAAHRALGEGERWSRTMYSTPAVGHRSLQRADEALVREFLLRLLFRHSPMRSWWDSHPHGLAANRSHVLRTGSRPYFASQGAKPHPSRRIPGAHGVTPALAQGCSPQPQSRKAPCLPPTRSS
jgi:hypothetical protein